MDESEEFVSSSITQEQCFTSSSDLSSTHASSFQLPDQGENCLAKHIYNTIKHQDSERAELCSVENMAENRHSKQVVLTDKKSAEDCSETSDRSVPCSQPALSISTSSPVAALVPTTNESIPTQQLQGQTLLPDTTPSLCRDEEVPNVNDCIGHQEMNNTCKNSSNNYSFTVSQDDSYHILTDEDSCDASYLQSVTDSADAFNQHYQEKADLEVESINAAEAFSPEAFFASVPLFKQICKRPATILPKLNNTDHGVTIHSSRQGVPIAPKPEPKSKVPCYVLVVPAPLYYEKFGSGESLELQQDHKDDVSETVQSDFHASLKEIGATPEALRLPNKVPMHPPAWTPQPQKPARTPLPSTMIRVSPSPNRAGSSSSPLITVSTTSTPIQPLQGKKQQYVIVQGNNRHLKGIARQRDRFTTPELEENHQPIYLQGLPPQGFRRFWKTKEGSYTERTTKRSLAPLFSKVSPSEIQEATVPQTEKSPLTCIRSKLPCDREVPEAVNTSPDRKLLTDENLASSTLAPAVEEAESQTTSGGTVLECMNDSERSFISIKNKSDEITITPKVTPTVRKREDKERKKLRDRRYDAELKKAFHQLRQMVPRLQKSSSRGQILQEAIKYIEVLQKKVVGAGLLSTLQSLEAGRSTRSESTTKATPGREAHEVTENFLSPIICDVPDICSNIVTNTVEEPLEIIPKENGGVNFKDHTTAFASPATLISSVSLPAEELSCSFINSEGGITSIDSAETCEEGFTVEEVPLQIPFQQIQFLAVEPSDDNPVLTPRSPDEPYSQEPLTRIIPVVEVPGYTESGEYVSVVHEGSLSPHRDVLLSTMTTISQEGLTDLGVTLSPLLSPLGIFLSPGGDPSQESTIAVLMESKEGADTDEAIQENSHAVSGVISGSCTDMTSIAASVEVTTDQTEKRTPLTTSKTKRKSRPAQIVPSVSPLQASSEDNSTPSTPRCRDRRALQDQSNFEDARSPVGVDRRGQQKKVEDHYSSEESFHDEADENFVFAASQSCTPPGRVSGVLITGKRKMSSSRGRVGTRSGRRI